jgi:hypothetical protein
VVKAAPGRGGGRCGWVIRKHRSLLSRAVIATNEFVA